MGARKLIKSLLIQAIRSLPTGVSEGVASDWAHSNPGRHQLLYEQVHLRRLFSHLNVDCVFDVGANAGQYADMLRRVVNYSGPIISFEPIPYQATALRERAAGDPMWEIHEFALASTSGTAEFSIMAVDQFSSLANPKHDETDRFSEINLPVRKIEVETRTLDAVYAETARRFDMRRPYLKMDTQGFDLEVAKGGREVLANFVGLQSELAIVGLYDGAPKMHDVISEFDRFGFGLSALVPNNQGHFPALVEIDGVFVRKDLLGI